MVVVAVDVDVVVADDVDDDVGDDDVDYDDVDDGVGDDDASCPTHARRAEQSCARGAASDFTF
eukprot:337653-Pyramimonas_sp.AAC.1